jgi:uncharacterized membrane protein
MLGSLGQMSPSPTVVELDAGGWGVFTVLVFVIVAVLAIASVAVWVWALVDAIRVPDDRLYREGSKLLWVLVIVLLGVIGAIVYLAVGRPAGGAPPAPVGASGPPGSLPPPPG